jgi:PPP family 3-phenylpropionic acid transporter
VWGSAAFIGGALGGGMLLDVIDPRELIWVVVAAMAFNAGAACVLAPLGRTPSAASGPDLFAGVLLRDRRFLTVAAAAGLIQASHAVYYGFSALEWQAAGYDGLTIGALWTLGVLAEIVLFAASARLGFGPKFLLAAGAAGGVIRWGAMALDPPPLLLVILQCLHALSFGATHLGALGVVARLARAQRAATGQGFLAVALALVMAGAMGLSGELYGRWQGGAYWAMAVLAGAGGVVLLAGALCGGSERCDGEEERVSSQG